MRLYPLMLCASLVIPSLGLAQEKTPKPGKVAPPSELPSKTPPSTSTAAIGAVDVCGTVRESEDDMLSCGDFTKNESLANMSKFKDIKRLVFHGPVTSANFTDMSVDALIAVPELEKRLRSLQLMQLKKVTSAGWARLLNHFTLLEQLEAPGTALDDSSMEAIAKMSGLTELNLADAKVTCDGLLKLQSLEKLKTLKVDGIKGCKSKHAEALMEMKGLKVLNVRGSDFSKEDIKKMKAGGLLLPN